MSFQSDDRFDEFSWKSESTGAGGRSGTEIVLAKDGQLTIARNNGRKLKRSYKPDSAAVPDFLLDLVLSEMLGGSDGRVIVDTISAEGRLVEVAISRAPKGGPSPGEAGYRLDVDFLGEPRYSQKVYFDGEGQILRMLVEQNGTYLLERAGVEDMLRHFPDWADYFLREGAERKQF